MLVVVVFAGTVTGNRVLDCFVEVIDDCSVGWRQKEHVLILKNKKKKKELIISKVSMHESIVIKKLTR